jgi:hypothetical protein
MTAARRDGNHGSPFLAWIRAVRELDSREFSITVIDSDCWIHRFAPRKERGASITQVVEYLQLIEYKSFSAILPFAQRDTLGVVDALMRKKTATKDGRRLPTRIDDNRTGRPGCHRLIRWYGLHVLQMSTDSPDTSDRLLWDGKDIDQAMLIELLGFKRDPDKPSRFVDSRRHHLRPEKENHPHLFEEVA